MIASQVEPQIAAQIMKSPVVPFEFVAIPFTWACPKSMEAFATLAIRFERHWIPASAGMTSPALSCAVQSPSARDDLADPRAEKRAHPLNLGVQLAAECRLARALRPLKPVSTSSAPPTSAALAQPTTASRQRSGSA